MQDFTPDWRKFMLHFSRNNSSFSSPKMLMHRSLAKENSENLLQKSSSKKNKSSALKVKNKRLFDAKQ